MSSMTQSEATVKPQSKAKMHRKPATTAQIVRALRRAKAPATAKSPTKWGYRLTDSGEAAIKALDDEELKGQVREVLATYVVSRDGDHLRFQGPGGGADFARVSLPKEGEVCLVWPGWFVTLPAAAFLGAAAIWMALHDTVRNNDEVRNGSGQEANQ